MIQNGSNSWAGQQPQGCVRWLPKLDITTQLGRMGHYHSVVSKHSWTFSNHIFTCPSLSQLFITSILRWFASYTGLESPPRTPTDVHLTGINTFPSLWDPKLCFYRHLSIAPCYLFYIFSYSSLLVVLHQYTQKILSILFIRALCYGLNVCVPKTHMLTS